jgi:hypothetical protein
VTPPTTSFDDPDLDEATLTRLRDNNAELGTIGGER